jgi:hypothetical protein
MQVEQRSTLKGAEALERNDHTRRFAIDEGEHDMSIRACGKRLRQMLFGKIRQSRSTTRQSTRIVIKQHHHRLSVVRQPEVCIDDFNRHTRQSILHPRSSLHQPSAPLDTPA